MEERRYNAHIYAQEDYINCWTLGLSEEGFRLNTCDSIISFTDKSGYLFGQRPRSALRRMIEDISNGGVDELLHGSY